MISTMGISFCRQKREFALPFKVRNAEDGCGVKFITYTFKPVFHMKYKLLNSDMSIKIMSALNKNNVN